MRKEEDDKWEGIKKNKVEALKVQELGAHQSKLAEDVVVWWWKERRAREAEGEEFYIVTPRKLTGDVERKLLTSALKLQTGESPTL